jgi:hypothetical protein
VRDEANLLLEGGATGEVELQMRSWSSTARLKVTQGGGRGSPSASSSSFASSSAANAAEGAAGEAAAAFEAAEEEAPDGASCAAAPLSEKRNFP